MNFKCSPFFSDLLDFITTFNKYQFLFNFSISVVYFLYIRIAFHMIKNDNENGWKQFSHLRFLNCSDDEALCGEYVINKKEAKSFFKLTDIFVKLTKTTVFFFYAFVTCITARVFYTCFHTIPFIHIVFSTLPNGISFYIVIFFCYQSANAFFLIYFLGNIFISKSIKSISKRSSNFNKTELINLAETNLRLFKGKQF